MRKELFDQFKAEKREAVVAYRERRKRGVSELVLGLRRMGKPEPGPGRNNRASRRAARRK